MEWNAQQSCLDTRKLKWKILLLAMFFSWSQFLCSTFVISAFEHSLVRHSINLNLFRTLSLHLIEAAFSDWSSTINNTRKIHSYEWFHFMWHRIDKVVYLEICLLPNILFSTFSFVFVRFSSRFSNYFYYFVSSVQRTNCHAIQKEWMGKSFFKKDFYVLRDAENNSFNTALRAVAMRIDANEYAKLQRHPKVLKFSMLIK